MATMVSAVAALKVVATWLVTTAALAAILWLVSLWRGHAHGTAWIFLGVATSLITSLLAVGVGVLPALQGRPLPSLLGETAIRLGVPLAVLMGLSWWETVRLDEISLIYFLPFQLNTLILSTVVAVQRVAALHQR